jgi:hypothetical protein
MMDRTTIKGEFMKQTVKWFWTEMLNFLLFLSLVFTGVVIKYVLPPGTGRPRGGGRGFGGGREVRTLWGWDRHEWGELHFWLAALLVIALAIHLVQHRRWIACRFQKGNGG